MRTLTLTRRFMSRQQIPLSGTPPFGTCTGCVVVGVPWIEALRRVLVVVVHHQDLHVSRALPRARIFLPSFLPSASRSALWRCRTFRLTSDVSRQPPATPW